MTLPGILFYVGLVLVFIAEQIVGPGVARWVLDALGVALVVGSLVLRARGLSAEDPSVRDGHLKALITAGIATASLAVYALSTDEVSTLLGFAGEDRQRWQGVLGVLTPVVLVLGAVPMAFLDLVLSGNPVVLPRDAAGKALSSGLYAALAVALVFPLNVLADAWSPQPVETAYFRTSRVGPATRGTAAGLTEPVTVYAFFPPGNDVLLALEPYLDTVDAAGGDQLTVEVRDQATSPALAEELKLTSNGWIVIQQGDSRPSKFKMRLEKRRAERDLERFDELFLKNLLEATRGERQAYFVTGHGEADHRVEDDDWRKLSDFRKALQDQGYDVDQVGAVDGLTEQVPADADVLIIAAPTEPLLEAEVETITGWLQEGGELLVLLDSRSDPLTGLLGELGLTRTEGILFDLKRRLRGAPPYVLVTDRYGTHASVQALSRQRQWVPFVLAAGLETSGQVPFERTPLVRTYGSTFADANLDARQGEDEESRVYDLGYAVEGGEGEQAWRAVVLGNVRNVSDQAGRLGWRPGFDLALDSIRWLGGEESAIGGTESEKDVKIDVTTGAAVWWFWSTIFLVPFLVLGAGIGWTTLRRRQR
jgi:hypothetical protein